MNQIIHKTNKLIFAILMFSLIQSNFKDLEGEENSRSLEDCIIFLSSTGQNEPTSEKVFTECREMLENSLSTITMPELDLGRFNDPIEYKQGKANFDIKEPLHSANEFLSQTLCFQCHEMKPLINDYLKSSHYQNDSDEIATCGSCHIKPGLMNELEAKVNGVLELLIHASGKYDKNPSRFNFLYKLIHFKLNMFNPKVLGDGVIPIEKRSNMSHNVLTDITEHDSIVCMKCHGTFEYKKKDFDSQNAFARKKHASAMKNRRDLISELKSIPLDVLERDLQDQALTEIVLQEIIEKRDDLLNPPEEEKITCIDCHKYPAHKKPSTHN